MKIKWKCLVGSIVGLPIGVGLGLYLAFWACWAIGYIVLFFVDLDYLNRQIERDRDGTIFSAGFILSFATFLYAMGVRDLYNKCKETWH